MLARRFELVVELGRGGMGVVWRARDLEAGGEVALKILPREIARDPAAVKRLLREAGRMAELDHPHIARVVACGTHEEPPVGPLAWLATELLTGPSLRELLAEEGAMPLARVVELLRPVAEAIDHAHRLKVVHMDVKPANILFTAPPEEGGVAKLIDFGIAHELHETLSLTREELEAHLEEEPALTGTPAYMSPEQYRGEPPRATTDVWALAVIAYQLLGDRLPFEGSPSMRRKQVLGMDPEPVRLQHDPSYLASRVNEVLLHGLAKDRTRRHATAMALMADLELVLRPPPVPTGERVERPWFDLRGGLFLMGALTVTLAGLVMDPLGGDRFGPSRDFPVPIEVDNAVPAVVEGNRSVWRAYLAEGWKLQREGDTVAARQLFELARDESRRMDRVFFERYISVLSLAFLLQEAGEDEQAAAALEAALAMK